MMMMMLIFIMMMMMMLRIPDRYRPNDHMIIHVDRATSKQDWNNFSGNHNLMITT